PFLKNNNAGIFRIPYFTEISGLLSTFTFPTTAFPSYSVAISSTTGPTMRQGPHHSAQKSISTGLSDFKTSSSKLPSVISNAIIFNFSNFSLNKNKYKYLPIDNRHSPFTNFYTLSI